MDILLCQMDPIVGDLKENTEEIIRIIKTDVKIPCIYIFPELAISGYPPLDLLDSSAFIDEQISYVHQIIDATKNLQSIVIFGYIEKNHGAGRNLFNSAMVCYQGKVLYNYRKRLLPTYDVFDEARYFEPGNEMGLFNFRGKRIGLLICEDLWYKNKFYTLNPAQELFNARADMIISINASPSVVGKFGKKLDMVRNISLDYGIPIIYVNQVGANDDIVFDGNSFVINERGVLVAISKKNEKGILCIPHDALEAHALGYHNGIHPIVFEDDAQFFYEQAVAGVRGYIKQCGL